MLSNGTEAIERLSVKKSYDCVIFNRCNGENDTNDVSILKYLRDLAKARDIVLVDCTHDCSPETCPEHDVAFGSGVVFWCNKQGLPSIQEMRQSLCYALLSSRSNSTSPDSSSNEEAKAAMEMKPICTRVKPRRTNSGVAQSA